MKIVIKQRKDGRPYQAVVDTAGNELAQYSAGAQLQLVDSVDRRNSATAQLVPAVLVNGEYYDLLA